MRAGGLDRLITIQKFGLTEDQYGDQVEGFTGSDPIAARVKNLAGAERLVAAQNGATMPTVFQIRWTPALDPAADQGLNPKDRVEYPSGSGRLYNVTSAIELGRHDTIEITATVSAD